MGDILRFSEIVLNVLVMVMLSIMSIIMIYKADMVIQENKNEAIWNMVMLVTLLYSLLIVMKRFSVLVL